MLNDTAAETLRRRQPDLAGRLFSACLPARLFGPRWGTRLAARLWAASLDQELADGADPAACPQLAARAAYLTCPETRARLAAIVERFVTAAELPTRAGRVHPARGGVRANREQMLELAARLRALARRDDRPRPVILAEGDLRLDPAAKRAWRAGTELHMTPKEFFRTFHRHLPDRLWELHRELAGRLEAATSAGRQEYRG